MSRLRIAHSLSSLDCHRVVYSIFEVNNCRLIGTQIRFPHRLGKSSKFSVSAYSDEKIGRNIARPVDNVSVGATKFVSSHVNKITPLVASNIGRRYGRSLNGENFILSKSYHPESYFYTNVRRFSDESAESGAFPPNLQLVGYWKSLSESAPVEFAQDSLIWLHSATGLPWWATIILATWSLRTFVTLPLALHQNYVLAKFYNLKDEINTMVKELKNETDYAVYRFKWTESYARSVYNRSFKQQKQKLIERDNCHPMKCIILVLVQIPMWITLSVALRNMAYMLPYRTESAHALYLELTTGGFGWVTNLTVTDGTLALPVIVGLLNLTIIEMQCLMKSSEPSKAQKYLTNFFRLVSIGMIPLAAYVPTSMSLYWASSSAFGIFQNFLVISPKFRRLARIPPTDVELEQPYRVMYTNLRRRLGLKNDYPTGDKKIANTSQNTVKHR